MIAIILKLTFGLSLFYYCQGEHLMFFNIFYV
jgi:hypothetical protein